MASDIQNVLFDNIMNIFYSLSFYSPIILCFSIILFSMFTGSLEKAFVFYIWIFIITFVRIIFMKGFSSTNSNEEEQIPNICLTGLTQIFIPKDITYSTFILTFTLMYFLMPMIMISKQNKINAINYGVLAFFISYIMMDLFIKRSLSCITAFFSTAVIGDIIGGLLFGALISGILMYGSSLKSYLYINEVNNNKEVCSMPSKQQFKCRVFKDGTLIGNL